MSLLDELAEYGRRLWDAEIFDDVSVKPTSDKLAVIVREKWTLIPSGDFSSGQTLRDSYFNVNLTEYNGVPLVRGAFLVRRTTGATTGPSTPT